MYHNEKSIFLHDLFSQIYCLYINKRELCNIKSKLDQKHIQANYFKGINGKKTLQDKYKMYGKQIHSIGAFGHIHSFMAILNDAIANNYETILILESDIYFDIDFDEKINKLPQYKLLYLGCSQHNWNDVTINDNYYYANKTCGTFAIALHKSILKEYLNLLEEFTYPSDTCLFKLQEKYYGECFVIYPNIIICNVTHSLTDKPRSQLEIIQKFKWHTNYDYWDLILCDSLKGITIIEKFQDCKLLIIEDNIDIINQKVFHKQHYEYNINRKVFVFVRNMFIRVAC